MSTIKKNILANVVGKTWSGLVWLVVLPIYLKFLGVEAYGLVGFYLTLTAVLMILDLGFGPTINRELARLSVQDGKRGQMRDVLRTLESAYWTVALVMGAAMAAVSPLIANRWLKPQSLDRKSTRLNSSHMS